MSETVQILPDQEPGAPHPRETFELHGHEAAEAEMARALAGGRLHHAWMLHGPKGVGKATLAWRFARVLLGARPVEGGRPLAVAPDDPVARRLATGGHPDLRPVTRMDSEGQVQRQVTIGSVRTMIRFFELSADQAGGRRVAIVDAADDMNDAAQNALLKTLEEPPSGAVLLLVCHAPGALLPTIRSRCRRLALSPLDPQALADAVPEADAVTRALSGGCPGRARALAALDAGRLYTDLSRHLSGLPRAPLDEALALAEAAARPERFHALFDMLEGWLARAARAATGLAVDEIEPGESAALARLAANAEPGAAAELWSLVRRTRHAATRNNLDPGLATLDMLRAARQRLAPVATGAA